MGHNEMLVRKAMASYGGNRDDVVIASKGGITRSEGNKFGRDGSLSYLRSAVEKSLRNLGVDVIDVYQWHRPDRSIAYGEGVENFRTLRDEGKIKAIGISNANVEEIEVAIDVLGPEGLVSVQNEFSPKFRCSEDELDYCAEHGIAFLPWSPLGGTGGGAREVGDRFAVFGEIAAEHGVSPQQVVLAWELSLGEHVIPIPGARRSQSIIDSAKAADLTLSDEELARLRRRRKQVSAAADVIIVGGGHNGLIAAAYLGRAGHRVTVLEARDTLGGAVASAAAFPGVDARLSRFSYLVSLLPEKLIADLGLELELRSRPIRSYTPVGDTGRLVRRSAQDQTALDRALVSFAAVVEPTLTEPLPRAGSLRDQVDPALWSALVDATDRRADRGERDRRRGPGDTADRRADRHLQPRPRPVTTAEPLLPLSRDRQRHWRVAGPGRRDGCGGRRAGPRRDRSGGGPAHGRTGDERRAG